MKHNSDRVDYTHFSHYVRDSILEYIDDKSITDAVTQVCIVPVIKNNETVLDALQIYEDGISHCPMIYLNTYYDEYCEGTPVDEIMRSIVQFYVRSRKEDFLLSPETLCDYSSIRSRIVMRVVNFEKNKHILERCPYRNFMDLAITYRILAAKNEGGISTVLVTTTMMEQWSISESQLYDIAIKNSVELFPPRIKNLRALIDECTESMMEDGIDQTVPGGSYDDGLYVGTNDCGINGATVLCYPGVLEDFSNKIGSDLYILPSSVHEVILLSAKTDILPETLVSMVTSANASIVAKDEILSDSIYYYCAKDGKIEKYSGQI